MSPPATAQIAGPAMAERPVEGFDLTGAIIAYEDGTASPKQSLDLFAFLIRTGSVWSLQGSYGRTAARLIEEGWINVYGRILREPTA